MKNKKIIISGGGTGGHLYPALSIADTLKQRMSDVEIIFVGAKNRIEAKKVPQAGYDIKLLPITGFARRLTAENLVFPFKLAISLWKARQIVKKIKPNAVVGVGGYASGPLGYMASKRRVPLLIQEQNSYPGITNKILARYAEKICVAYPNTERFFPKDKIIITGNPIRTELLETKLTQEEAKQKLGFDPNKKLILSIGGSGGAGSINEGIAENVALLEKEGTQILWQTGKFYYEKYKSYQKGNIKTTAFIDNMAEAYKAADLVISRAGASSVSELCLLKKPAILIPSSYVAEDHQTKNAQALVENNATILIKDSQTKTMLIPKAIETVNDDATLKKLAENIYKHAKHNSAEKIVDEIIKLIK